MDRLVPLGAGKTFNISLATTAVGKLTIRAKIMGAPEKQAIKMAGGTYDRATMTWQLPVGNFGDFTQIAREHGCYVNLMDPHKISCALMGEIDKCMTAYKVLGRLRECAPHNMFPYQVHGAEYLIANKRALLLDEMGLGKTVQALMALPFEPRGIILCPASLRLNWQAEGQAWRKEITFSVLKGKDAFRFPEANECVILSPESLPDGMKEPRWFDGQVIPLSMSLIADEAHMYKSPKSKRTMCVRNLVSQCKSAWAMTGTPITNTPMDLWSVLRVFGLHTRLFGDFDAFAKAFGGKRGPFGWLWPDKPTDADYVRERLSAFSIRRTRKTVLPQIPAKQYHRTVVDVGELEVPDIGDLDQFIKHVDEKDFDFAKSKMPDVAANIHQMRSALAERKIPAMLDIVDRHKAAGQRLVIVSANRAPLDALRDRGIPVIDGSTKMLDRHTFVEDFQDGDHQFIGLNPVAGGVGLTLTAAHRMLFVQRDWSPSVNAQAEDRICRIGQNNHCQIYDLVGNHAVDARLYQLLVRKTKRIDSIITETLRIPQQVKDLERLVSYAQVLD